MAPPSALLAPLQAAMASSDYLRYVQCMRSLFTDALSLPPLTQQEIDKLKRHGNTADDWSRVRKTRADVMLHATRIRDCAFQGVVVLGQFDRDVQLHGTSFAAGCYRSTLRNAAVLDNALVRDVVALSDTVVDSFASVVACGFVRGPTSKQTPTFANGMTVHVGVEVGGRDVRVTGEMPFDVAAAVATRRNDLQLLEQVDALVDEYAQAASAPCSIIARHARVAHCAHIVGCFIGPYAVVDDADVRNATILSSQEEPSSVTSRSVVRDAIVQWNSTVETQAFVERALLCDTSHVERHGIVMSAIVGPNTGVAEGEITSSLVGPFVGFHHQALLIASVWPEGKGNIGYGANVGSNHTLKAPDQELLPGEGVFFGLGCCVKFPSNFQKAPYSVIATGVSTLPQCLEMPFALINAPGHNIPGLSPAINEISPAWVLKHSVFTALRNEYKFATRNRSKRTQINADVLLRPDLVKLMIDARKQLHAAAGKATITLSDEKKEVIYTDKQVPGLGKNYMREAARLEAIGAYSFFIQLYALEGLLVWLEEEHVKTGEPLPTTIDAVPRSSGALELLRAEFPSTLRVTDALRELVHRRQTIVRDAIKGKGRDDARGKRIISDYALVHSPVEGEGPVKYAKRVAEEAHKRVSRFIAKL